MVTAKTAIRPIVTEEAGPIPGNRALAPLAVVPLKRIETVPTLEDNAALAAELGFEPEDLEDLRLQHFLAANSVRVFDYEAVCQRMNALVTPIGARWFWSPLRPKDGEGKWWQPGKIIDAYMGCADDAVLESDPALVALRAFMAKQGFFMSDDGDQTEFRYWKGSGEALLDALTGFAPEGALRNKQCPWPADATRLSGRLSMAGPALRQRGVTIERGRSSGGNRTRWISIKALDTADTELEAA